LISGCSHEERKKEREKDIGCKKEEKGVEKRLDVGEKEKKGESGKGACSDKLISCYYYSIPRILLLFLICRRRRLRVVIFHYLPSESHGSTHCCQSAYSVASAD